MTTFDGASNANYTLSNGNLTAANSTSQATWETLLTTTSKSTGKWGFEMVVDQPHSTGGSQYDSWGFGFVNTSFTNDDFPGHTSANGFMADCGNANSDMWYNSTQHAGFAGTCFQPGDVLQGLLDITNGGRIWVRDVTRDAGTPHWWGANNNGADDPTTAGTGFSVATLVGSAVFAVFASSFNASPHLQASIRLSSSSFSAPLPSGFSSWDPPAPFAVDSRRNRSYLRR